MNGQFDLGAVTPQRYFFGIAVVLGLLFASVSEVDAGASVLTHFLVWQLQTVIPMGLFVGCHVLLERVPSAAGLNPWLQLVISGSLGAVLFTPVNLGIDVVLQGDELGERALIAALLGEILSMGPTAMISWVAINAPWVLGFRFETAGAETALEADSSETKTNDLNESSTDKQPHFMSLLPESQRGTLIYLKADLHYLSVITSKGRSLLLYNLRDAIAELPETMGLQCHRSYWVNLEQIDSFQKTGRQGLLKLTDGSEVPVSRSYVGLVAKIMESA